MISVIVPIFNMEACLEACVDSILEQSERDIEVILVDDGSTDGSAEICRRLAEGDPRVRVIRRPNGGAAAARNQGLDAASGDWICFADPDDSMPKGALARLLSAAGEKTDIVAGDFYAVVEGKKLPRHFFSEEMDAHSAREKMPFFLQLFDTFYGQKRVVGATGIGVPWAKLYRREFLESRGLRFDTALRRNEDNQMNLYAFSAADEIRYRHCVVYNYNYDHTAAVIRNYDPLFAETAQAIVSARRTAVEEVGLSSEKKIADAAVNEALNLFATALKRSIFHSKNEAAFSAKCKCAEKLISSEAFFPLFKSGSRTAVHGIKNRVFFELVMGKHWKMISRFLERE